MGDFRKMIFKQKKGFLLRDFVIDGIIFGLIISLFIISVASIANNYNNTNIISPSFAAHYSQLSATLSSLNTTYSAVKSPSGLNLIGTFNVIFNAVFTVVTMVWGEVTIYSGMIYYVPGDFSFLDQATTLLFLGGILAMVVAYLIFVWMSSVTRGRI
jgi:hypothetical protein